MIDLVGRRFIWFYAKTQLKLKYRYTSLGILWNVLEPAMFLAVLSIVFSVVNRMNIAEYAVFLFSALMPWRYFEKVVTTCMDSIVGGDWLLKKIAVSPFALPLSRWTIASFEFLLSLAVVAAFLAMLHHPFTIHLLVVPLAIVPWGLLGLGAGLVAAVLFTFWRDIRTVVQMTLMLAFFSSPILFRADTFEPGTMQARLVQLHPVTYFAALFQKPIYHAAWPSQSDWGVSFIVALLSVAIGIHLVNKHKSKFYFFL
jgi:ABC-type polysaccharide/polyol phosphate export permease